MGQIDELWRYDGRRVVVTGCASGIGAQLTQQLTELGAEVIGMDVRRPASDLDAFIEIDLADPASIERSAASIDGRIDALFNVAGISSGGGDGQHVVAVNFLGPRHLIDQLVPKMPSGSSVVAVSSLAARAYLDDLATLRELLNTRTIAEGMTWCDAHPDALADGGSYRLSKGAVILYTLDQSESLAAQGIRINCTCPGVTETPILDDTRAAFGQQYLDDIPKPLGRVADPAEQASVLAFLNSKAASYLTGEVLWVDGGYASSRRARDLLDDREGSESSPEAGTRQPAARGGDPT